MLPALREKHGEHMLRELVKRWDNHKLMARLGGGGRGAAWRKRPLSRPGRSAQVRWLSRFFNYLDRYYIARHSLAALKDVGMLCFRCGRGPHGSAKQREENEGPPSPPHPPPRPPAAHARPR